VPVQRRLLLAQRMPAPVLLLVGGLPLARAPGLALCKRSAMRLALARRVVSLQRARRMSAAAGLLPTSGLGFAMSGSASFSVSKIVHEAPNWSG
jgi:hypothetical protein